MKAVVVELNKNQVAVLSEDGCVITVKNKNYEIGQTIQINKPQINIAKKVTVFAASVAACLFLGVGTWAYASPYTYVSLDVNPSIVFSVNRFDRVIKAKAVNDDGEEILQVISLKDLRNEPITDAITSTVRQISDAGYFSNEAEGGIVIATSSEDTGKADALALELQETVEQETTDNGDNVAIEVFSVGLEQVEEARELGVTPGKLNLVENLKEAADTATDIDIEEWLNKPVKDIMKATKEYRNSKEETEDDSDETTTDDSDGTIADGSEDTIADGSEDTSDKDSEVEDQQSTDSKDDSDLDKAEKEAEKAKKDAAKATEKATKAQEKADKKAKEATNEQNSEDQKDAKLAAEQAKKEAEEALRAAEKANDRADKATEKAKKEAEKAKKEAEKTDNSNAGGKGNH